MDGQCSLTLFNSSSQFTLHFPRVCLWLGANVMLEYDIEEAIILLTKNLNTANVNGDQLEDDLGYLSNQVIKPRLSV